MTYSFPANLRRIRKAQKITQTELGDMIGVTQVAISSYERGTKYPCIDRVYDLARALGVDIVELVR